MLSPESLNRKPSWAKSADSVIAERTGLSTDLGLQVSAPNLNLN